MFPRRRYRELTCVLCAAGAVVAAIIAGNPTRADEPLLDRLVWARSAILPDSVPGAETPVAVIALDRRSLEAPELARYPRAFLAPVWAEVIDGVFEAGAQALGFDLLFSYSANQFVPNFERPFLAALGKHSGQVVLARSATTLPAPAFLAALHNDEGALGVAELSPDPDGRYRRVRATHETLRGDALKGFAEALLGRRKAPAMPDEIVLAPRRHLEMIPTYALVDVLRCAKQAPEALRPAFSGKIVLVGGTLPEEDRRISSGRFLAARRTDGPVLHPCGLRRLGASSPDSPSVPGVFLHAAAIEAVATGRVTSVAPSAVVAGLSAATAAGGSAIGLALSPWLAGAMILATGVLLIAGATALLAADLWVPVALPLGALAGGYILAYIVRYLIEEKMRRQIQGAFGHYLSPAIVARLTDDPAALQLGGDLREVTVMFADLTGFTALSSKVEPERLMGITNQYLGYIVEQVEATGGYVDKFIGDAVMAIWGAPVADPRHAVNGVRAALAAVGRIRRERGAAAGEGEIGFSVKIGLNSGLAVVGNVGTEKRYNYTAVGEAVNIASRLESVPEFYGCKIVVGPRTAELAKGEYLMRELGSVQIKGLETPLAVFEPVAEHSKATLEQIDRTGRYAEALAHYRAMRFADAYTIWTELAQGEQEVSNAVRGSGEPSGPAFRMAEQARALAAHPPDQLWDGVWVLTSK